MSFRCVAVRLPRSKPVQSSFKSVATRSFASTSSKSLLGDSLTVTPSWLASHLPYVRVVDASWFPRSMNEDPLRNFILRRIPGATFFDIEKICDTKSDLPHMLPKVDDFARVMGEELGLSEDDNIVVYDTRGIFSSPRVWFTLRAMGATNVAILSGGLPQWRREQYPLASGPAIPVWPKKKFNAKLNSAMVKTYDDVVQNISSKSAQVIDARSPGRFEGVEPEPRPGLRHGHIPNSVNVPWFDLLNDFTGLLHPVPILKSVFARHGVDLSDKDAPKIATCGSGITACVTLFALQSLGHHNVALYDGSWADYGSRHAAVVETGGARK